MIRNLLPQQLSSARVLSARHAGSLSACHTLPRPASHCFTQAPRCWMAETRPPLGPPGKIAVKDCPGTKTVNGTFKFAVCRVQTGETDCIARMGRLLRLSLGGGGSRLD